jgi:CheY-like chemotaxis protein
MRGISNLTKLPTVLMVSAYGQDEVKAEAEAAGISAFLVKPIEPTTLLETITALIAADKSDAPVRATHVDSIPMVAPELRG